MAVSVGDILFTSLITDTDATPSTFDDSFSFIATTNIAAGEVITFHAPESNGDATFTFTVGPNGLSAFDRVTIQTDAGASTAPAFLNDPSNGTLGNYVFTGTLTSFSIIGADNLIASSGGVAIAGIVNNTTSNWDDNIDQTGLDRTAIDAAIALPTDPLPVFTGVTSVSADDDNSMFVGGDITGIDDPSNWVFTGDAQTHSAPNISGTTFATQDASIFCFGKGSRIATPSGEVPVETLNMGDLVLTADGRAVPVLWLGRQTVVTRFAGERARLVRIAEGALGNHSDLFVTQDHGMILEDCVVNAGALVGQQGIDLVPLSDTPERFTVYHIETEAHDAILANGAASETFIDYQGRRAFDNFAEFEARFGDDRSIAESPMPRVTRASALPQSLRARLSA